MPESDRFHHSCTVSLGAQSWVQEAMSLGPEGNRDSPGEVPGDLNSGSEFARCSASSSSSSDHRDAHHAPHPQSRGTDNTNSH
jgi:hypothetical protein